MFLHTRRLTKLYPLFFRCFPTTPSTQNMDIVIFISEAIFLLSITDNDYECIDDQENTKKTFNSASNCIECRLGLFLNTFRRIFSHLTAKI